MPKATISRSVFNKMKKDYLSRLNGWSKRFKENPSATNFQGLHNAMLQYQRIKNYKIAK